MSDTVKSSVVRTDLLQVLYDQLMWHTRSWEFNMGVYLVKNSQTRYMDACAVAAMTPEFIEAGLSVYMTGSWGDVEYGPHDAGENTKYGVDAMEYVLGITKEEAKHLFHVDEYVLDKSKVDTITKGQVADRVRDLLVKYSKKPPAVALSVEQPPQEPVRKSALRKSRTTNRRVGAKVKPRHKRSA